MDKTEAERQAEDLEKLRALIEELIDLIARGIWL